MNFTPIPGSPLCEGYCIVKSTEKKNSNNGSVYLDMILSDNSGDISAKLWDYKENPANTFAKFDFVKVRGQIGEYRGVPQFRIDRIRKVNESDDVDISDYVPSACLSGETMLEEIELIIDSFEDEDLIRLTKAVISKYREKLIYWPAAKGLHHAVRGGLLMHTLTILRMAYSVCSIYTYINYDLLCAGAILHDITKIEEIDASKIGVPGEYTAKGNLLGHLVMGAMEVEKTGTMLGIAEEKLMLLEHMLISHHGEPEFGAARRPSFIEAEVLSQLDNFDAKLYEISTAVLPLNPGEFTQRMRMLDDRSFYNHGLSYDGDVNIK